MEPIEILATGWKLLAGLGNWHWILGTLALGFFVLFVNTLRALFRAEERCDQLERDLCQEMFRRSEAEWKLMQAQETAKLAQESAYVFPADARWTCSDAGSLDLAPVFDKHDREYVFGDKAPEPGHVAEKLYSVHAGEQEIYMSPEEVQKLESAVRESQENQARAYMEEVRRMNKTGESALDKGCQEGSIAASRFMFDHLKTHPHDTGESK